MLPKKMQKNIEKNAKKCMTNDKIYAILIIVYCSLCKWSMGHSAERKHYGLFCCFPFLSAEPERPWESFSPDVLAEGEGAAA